VGGQNFNYFDGTQKSKGVEAEIIGNFRGSYSLLNGKLKGLGFGAGVMYASEAWVNAANTVTMPSYSVIDASIFYNTPQFLIGFKANNIGNSKYRVSDGFLSHYQPTVKLPGYGSL
jgi:iron complex outermembrane receptor protein